MKKLFWVSITVVLLFSCTTTKEESNLYIEYYNVGNGYMDQGKLDEAVKFYKLSLEMRSESVATLYNLSIAYLKMEKYDLALEVIENILNLDKKNGDVLALKAYALYKMGDLESSLEIYLYLSKVRESDDSVLLSILKLEYQLGNFESARKYLDKLMNKTELVLSELDMYYIGAYVYYELELYQESGEYFEAYIENGGKDIDVFKKLRELYAVSGELTSEKNVIESLIEFKADSIGELYFRLGEIYYLLNDYSNGFKNLEKSHSEGYVNEERLNNLLENPDLHDIDRIRAIFESE